MTFDPNEFLNQQVEGELSTQFTPIPPGEYVAAITKLEAEELPKKDGTGVFTILHPFFEIDDARAKEATGQEKPTIRDSIFLDLTDDGKLDTGKNKNVQLGRLFDAVGLNSGTRTPGQLAGQACKIMVTVDPDKNDPNRVYNRIKSYGKL